MDFDAVEQLWRSQAGQDSAAADGHMLEMAMTTLDRRRKAAMAGAGLIGLTLLILTMFAVAAMFGQAAAPARDWGGIGLLGLSWLAFLAWPLVRGQPERVDAAASMPDVLRGLIGENRASRARARVMAVILPGAIVLLAVCLWQLHAAGKIERGEAAQMFALLGGALLLSAIVHTIRYLRWLKPEGERLQRLLDQYRGDD